MLRPFKMNPLLGLGLGASFILVCVFFPFSGRSYTSNREPHFEKTGRRCCLQTLLKLSSSSPVFSHLVFLFLKVLPSAHLPRKYPPVAQLRHDAVATSVASCCGTAVEIFLCRAWATGQLAMQPTLQEAPLWPLGLSSGRTLMVFP